MSHQSTGEIFSRNMENQSDNDGVRLIVLNLPEDEGEGLGFRVTRTLWDPYPWVREVTPGSRADAAGLKTGDCLLQADGRDLLGLPVGQVAGLIRGDGAGGGVSLLVWNCGVDPKDDPELLWSCGGGSRGERSRRALAGVLRALSCCVCASTATRALHCARSHLYCETCWTRLERCALCREPLPPKNSPYSRNLVAEQVFEAIATEYEIKTAIRRPTETASATASPNRSPSISPSIHRKGQYQLSMMSKRKPETTEKYRQIYSSDPNIHNSTNASRRLRNPTSLAGNSRAGNINCNCHSRKLDKDVQTQLTSNVSETLTDGLTVQHRLVTRLRPACSLADLQNSMPGCRLSTSLNNLGEHSKEQNQHSNSLDNLKSHGTALDAPVFLVSPTPVYLVTCGHSQEGS
ncbi:uncharacterized protein LOC114244404 [Bombyx mandarina]|uniref:Uncharacterized protein LOC114244404 n=1 Tax=Bombyx mandarina TaxID=7092 RepID=A0A6J2JRT2_BOMMA|nr:uncharacterized protein LOC114244404 [Bombyx mandarina]XP_028032004.1 uncharacterized protein LOC114244404 [Bombyx mandarina]